MADETISYDESLKQFVQNALAPKRVKTDSGEVEQQTLTDQIKALDRIKQEVVSNKKPLLSRLGVYRVVNTED